MTEQVICHLNLHIVSVIPVNLHSITVEVVMLGHSTYTPETWPVLCFLVKLMTCFNDDTLLTCSCFCRSTDDLFYDDIPVLVIVGQLMTCFCFMIHSWPVFSSPELKAQASVRLSVRLSVCPSVNFSYFRLLLKNHWDNFNQSSHKATFYKGESSLFKLRATSFPKGR